MHIIRVLCGSNTHPRAVSVGRLSRPDAHLHAIGPLHKAHTKARYRVVGRYDRPCITSTATTTGIKGALLLVLELLLLGIGAPLVLGALLLVLAPLLVLGSVLLILETLLLVLGALLALAALLPVLGALYYSYRTAATRTWSACADRRFKNERATPDSLLLVTLGNLFSAVL